MAGSIIIIPTDERYAPLADDLIASIRSHAAGKGTALAVLDLGLDPDRRARYRADGIILREPKWDYDVSHFTKPPQRYLLAMAARPFFPRYFPGYDVYLHLDADTWVQDWAAIDLLVASALQKGFAAVPQVDRCFIPSPAAVLESEWRYRAFRYCFDEKSSRLLQNYPTINAGVFAIHAEAPHWRMWGEVMAQIIASSKEYYFPSDQISLNAVIWAQRAPVALLPAWCNWVCLCGIPMCTVDGRILTESQPPYRPLGIVHLVGGDAKNRQFRLNDPNGGVHERTLRFRGESSRGELPRVDMPDDLHWGNVAWTVRKPDAPGTEPGSQS